MRHRAESLGFTLTWYRTPDGWRFTLTDHTTGRKRTSPYLALVQAHLNRAEKARPR
ncbi:hypothetical protein NOGI109294_15665 [Nocardiopsis gilva]|uniref:hypothetical protein n=1 Tax=Nocardiopsis gilva TaxID=280236 RepID=UPI00034D71CA|nr:hypothetical protein [Nocardiopsis gilva]